MSSSKRYDARKPKATDGNHASARSLFGAIWREYFAKGGATGPRPVRKTPRRAA